jgi:hypothetical protein
MIRDTTLSAYIEIQPELSARQLQVFEALKSLGEANNLMISKFLGLPINSITPRTNELYNILEVIEIAVKKKCPHTQRTTYFWRIK